MSTQEPSNTEHDPCDYILCESNLQESNPSQALVVLGDAGVLPNLKKCAGCSLARYCVGISSIESALILLTYVSFDSQESVRKMIGRTTKYGVVRTKPPTPKIARTGDGSTVDYMPGDANNFPH